MSKKASLMTLPWLNNAEISTILRSMDWTKKSFDIHKLYIMSIFSELVYHKITEFDYQQYRRATVVPCFAFQELFAEKRSDIEELVRQMRGELIDVFDRRYFVAAIIQIGPIKIIAIRGTSALYDWTINLNVRTVAFQGGRLHRGFFSETIETLCELIKTPHLDKGIIYVTGHSLGGALAALMSRIASRSISANLVSVYTFGMPRYGDNKSIYQWVEPYSCIRPGDPVPNVPPELFGFEDPAFLYNPGGQRAEFERGISGINFVAFNYKNLRLGFFEDHAMERYLEDTLLGLRNASTLI